MGDSLICLLLEKLKEGDIDIVIGTHALLNKQVAFKDLGLFIIDEEQKFEVAEFFLSRHPKFLLLVNDE